MRIVKLRHAYRIAVIGAFIATSLFSQTIGFQSTNGPFGGRVTGFGRSANGTLFAGIYYDKVYRSRDQGINWEPLDFSNTEYNQSVQFAWDDKGTVLAYWGRELYVSKNNGHTWTGRPDPPGYLFGIAKNGHFFSNGYNGGIYRSTDEGLTWAEYASGDGALAFLACDAGMYIGTDRGLYFIPAFDKPRWLSPQISPITSLAQSNGYIWATTYSKGLYRRAMNDTNWQSIIKSGNYFWKVGVNEPGTVFLEYQDENSTLFKRTNDQGLTWDTILPHITREDFNFITSGQILLLQKEFTDHIMLSSDEGETWTVPVSGINSSWIAPHSLMQNRLGHLFAITGENDVYVTWDKGQSWQHQFASPLTMRIHCLMVDAANNLWVGADSGQVFISEDGGQNWYQRNIFPSNRSVRQMSSNGQGLMAASFDGGSIWVSIDNGMNWRETDLQQYDTVITFSKRGDILVGTGSGIYKSTDEGSTWGLVRGGLDFPGPASPDQPVDVRDLKCLPGGEIIASVEKEGGENPRTVSHVFRSTDDGQTWEKVVNGSGGQIGYNKKGQVILSSGWYSFDSGQTWTSLYFLEHSSKRTTAVFMDEEGYCFLGTEGAGVWKSTNALSGFAKNLSGGIGTEITQAYGASWADYDNDGYDDVFLACAGPNRLYHNNGDGTFSQITTGAIATDNEPSRGATWGDYDNDGFIDVFVANENAANSLYHNNGNGTFTKITSQPLTTEVFASRAAAWADFDRDGFLDLFVAVLNGNNLLYKNNGNGTFTRITTGAIVNDGGVSYGCAWADYDLDGDSDLFVANYGNNFLYRNDGDGSFTKITDGPVVTDGGNSFGGSWGDYDNDGYPDLFVANTEGANYLYHNDRNGKFSRIMEYILGIQVGITKGVAWGDVNNDGWMDLYLAKNGADALYLNQRDGGLSKLNTTYFSLPDNSLACAWSDANRDGFLDLLVANYDATSNLYFNYFFNAGSTSQWTEIKCFGTISNRSAIGTLVQVKAVPFP